MVHNTCSNTPLQHQNALEYHPELFVGLHDKPTVFCPWQEASQMNGYPMPIVDEKTARKSAAEKLYVLRKNNTTHKETAQKIVSKHGSRRSGRPRTVGKKKIKNHTQGKLPL